MIKVFKEYPILSFLIFSLGFTYICWFTPIFLENSKDVKLGLIILGSCSPLISAFIINLNLGNLDFRLRKFKVFWIFLFISFLFFWGRLRFTNEGLDSINGLFPELSEMTPFGWGLICISMGIIAYNGAKGFETSSNHSYLSSFRFEKNRLFWYLLSLVFLPFLSLSSYFLGKFFGHETTDYLLQTKPVYVIGFGSTFLFFGGHEEFGWRGFLQPKLEMKFSPLTSAFLISFIWTLWHIPLYYNGVYSDDGIEASISRWLITIPVTIVFSWFYIKSKSSLLTVILLHSMFNSVATIFGSSSLILSILFFVAVAFFIWEGKMWKKLN